MSWLDNILEVEKKIDGTGCRFIGTYWGGFTKDGNYEYSPAGTVARFVGKTYCPPEECSVDEAVKLITENLLGRDQRSPNHKLDYSSTKPGRGRPRLGIWYFDYNETGLVLSLDDSGMTVHECAERTLKALQAFEQANDDGAKTILRLKVDWWAIASNSIPLDKDEFEDKAKLYPVGTLFIDFGKGDWSEVEDGDETPAHGWCYKLPDEEPDMLYTNYCNFLAYVLGHWRDRPDMFELVSDF